MTTAPRAGIRHLSKVFAMEVRISLSSMVQYQASTFIWLIGGVLEPLIFLVVWTTVARSQGGAVQGFTPSELAAYYIALMLVNNWIFTWIMWEYEYLIRDGSLARRLLRPMHPVVRDLAENISYKLLASTALVPAALLMVLLFEPRFSARAASFVAFVPALGLAFALRFSLEWCLAMAAFWTTRVGALNQVYFMLLLFFSGRLAPLEMLPDSLQTLAGLLPFRWMLSFPLEVLLGKSSGIEVLRGYLAQTAWVAIGIASARLAWRAGVRQFSAVGS
jgi:ABC-2 type transport system permease protein